MANNVTGAWDPSMPWPFIGIHAVVLQDGKVLSFGTEGPTTPGLPANMYHAIYDPATGKNEVINHVHTTQTDTFCSAAMIIPGTNQVLIAGGGRSGQIGVADSNLFDIGTSAIVTDAYGSMSEARWYPSMVSLPTGQIVVLSGTRPDQSGVAVPEIYTPGEGWRKLTGATDSEFATVAHNSTSWYPKTWLNDDGKIVYYANGSGSNGVFEVMELDPSGAGSVKKIGQLPFTVDYGTPSIMYEPGKVLAMASNGDLWKMDISGATPTFAKVGNAADHKDWSNMTVLADGKVLINGGGDMEENRAGADKAAVLFDPATNAISTMAAEAQFRLYHSTSILLNDGTLMAMGNTSGGGVKDAQIFKPPYLFDSAGQLAKRPVVTDAPDAIKPGESFDIHVDDASAISKITFSKTGAVTHGINMEARVVHLDFEKIDATTIRIKAPENVNDLAAGSWMLFAWNNKGVPSVAPVVAVEPTLSVFKADGSGGEPLDPGAQPGPELVHNGGFELGATGPGQSGDGWTLTGTGGVHNDPNRASFGDKFMALDGWQYLGTGAQHDAVLSQTINTVAGQTYTFKFTAKIGVARGDADGQVKMEAMNGATSVGSKTVGISGSKTEYSMTFVATGDKTVIKLSDVSAKGQADFDIDLDGVSVKAAANATPAQTGPELVHNGGFEMGAAGPGEAGMGWTLTGGGGVDGTVARAAAGKQYMALDGWANSHDAALSQTINTEAGKTYTFKFTASTTSGGVAVDGQVKMEALNGATAVGAKTVSVSGSKTEYSMTFVATGDKTVIKLSDVSPKGQSGFDIDVDAVSVKAALNATPVDPDTGHDHNLLSNSSFETAGAAPATPTWRLMENGQVGPWQSASNRIEVWNDGFGGIKATEGKNLVEVDAYNGALSQTVKTEAGKYYGISFDYAGRPDAIASSKMEVLWNGQVIGTVTPTDSTMKSNHLHVHGTGGNDVLTFRSVAGDNDSYGGLLDNVTLTESSHGENPPADGGGTGVTNMIMGTAGDDYLVDTDANDKIMLGDGRDTIYLGGKGDDIVDGQGGDYNQADLKGSASDYVFVRNADGTITVSSAATGTDTLTNIDGFWFYGEKRWYGADQLTQPANGAAAPAQITTEVNAQLTDTINDIVDLQSAIANWDFSVSNDSLADVFHALQGLDAHDGMGGMGLDNDALLRAVDALHG